MIGRLQTGKIRFAAPDGIVQLTSAVGDPLTGSSGDGFD